MSFPTVSYANIARGAQGQKRPVKEQLVNITGGSKKGPFTPSQDWIKFLTAERWFTGGARALPKSQVPHGLRIHFEGDPGTFQEASKAVKDAYPRAISLHLNPLKDFFDLGFMDKDDADQAAKVALTVQVTDARGNTTPKSLLTTRTRHNKEETIFISFDTLPLDAPRARVEAELKTGLARYGRIEEFELLKNPYMEHLTTSKAIALITPHKGVDIVNIPRRAFIFKAEGEASGDFRVFPEQTPPICNLCSAIGHREGLCPSTIQGAQAASEEEGVENPNPVAPNSNALIAVPWGEMADYTIIAPITSRQRKEFLKKTRPQTDTNSVIRVDTATVNTNIEDLMDTGETVPEQPNRAPQSIPEGPNSTSRVASHALRVDPIGPDPNIILNAGVGHVTNAVGPPGSVLGPVLSGSDAPVPVAASQPKTTAVRLPNQLAAKKAMATGQSPLQPAPMEKPAYNLRSSRRNAAPEKTGPVRGHTEPVASANKGPATSGSRWA